MSESGFAALDAEQTYRYRSFGVPGLGLRRGLARDRSSRPTPRCSRCPSAPRAAVENLRELERLGLVGRYGFYEAADFTPERAARRASRFAPVRSYMAHHQGMILAALDNALCDDALVRRVHADRRVRAVELLLHERVPREVPAGDRPRDERGQRRRRAARAVRRAEPWTPVGAGAVPRCTCSATDGSRPGSPTRAREPCAGTTGA